MEFTREECSHLTNILLDYIKQPEHLQETVFVTTDTTVTTLDVLNKCANGAIGAAGYQRTERARHQVVSKTESEEG